MKLAINSLIIAFFVAGCASKPEVIVKTQYQDVYVPIACVKEMPIKPKYSTSDLQSAKDLMGYFLTCEELLKGCVNGSDHKKD
nr:MAG TPA: TRAF PROTEIN, TRAO PROTEIN, TRAN ADHESION, BACTERIAL SECRETION.5A [Caudoviricetes sp.]